MPASVPPAKFKTLTRMWASLPPGWTLSESRPDGHLWANPKRHLSIIASFATYNHVPWLHLSIAHAKHLPTYRDIAYLRHHWLDDREAIMVFPEKKYDVHLHPRCLHLFACLGKNGSGLPQFSAQSEVYGRTI